MEQHIYEVLKIANTPSTNREISEMVDFVEKSMTSYTQKDRGIADIIEILGSFIFWLGIIFLCFIGILIF